jgi:hypothetical protein
MLLTHAPFSWNDMRGISRFAFHSAAKTMLSSRSVSDRTLIQLSLLYSSTPSSRKTISPFVEPTISKCVGVHWIQRFLLYAHIYCDIYHRYPMFLPSVSIIRFDVPSNVPNSRPFVRPKVSPRPSTSTWHCFSFSSVSSAMVYVWWSFSTRNFAVRMSIKICSYSAYWIFSICSRSWVDIPTSIRKIFERWHLNCVVGTSLQSPFSVIFAHGTWSPPVFKELMDY